MGVIRSAGKVFVSRTLSKAVVFAAIAYFAQELGAATLGAFFLFQAVLSVVAIVADFGLVQAVEKRVSEGGAAESVFTTALLLKLLIVGLFAGLILAFHGRINTYIGHELAGLLAVSLLIHELHRLMVSLLIGEQQVGQSAVLEVLNKTVWVSATVLLYAVGLEVTALVYGLIVGYTASTLWGNYQRETALGTPTRHTAESLIRFSKSAFIADVGGKVYAWADIIIIGVFLSQTAVGAYEVAWRVTAAAMLVSRSLGTAIFPAMSSWSADEASEKAEALISQSITPAVLVVIPAFFASLLFPEMILELMFGPEFVVAATAFSILMAEKMLHSVYIVFSQSLQALNRPDLAARAVTVAILSNIVLNLAFIPAFGITGAAVATSLSILMNFLMLTYYLQTILSLSIPWRELKACTWAALGMAGVLWVVNHIVEIQDLPSFLIIVGLGVILYGGLVLQFSAIRQRLPAIELELPTKS